MIVAIIATVAVTVVAVVEAFVVVVVGLKQSAGTKRRCVLRNGQSCQNKCEIRK